MTTYDQWKTESGYAERTPEEERERVDFYYDEIEDECPNCGGEGYVESCFEDTCVCVDPPCHWQRCDWCNPPKSAASGEKG